MKNVVFIFLLLTQYASAQETYTINGHFPNFPNSRYELKGYEGMQQKTLSTATNKEDGKFTLTYPKDYKGVAQLWMNGAYQVLLFLNKEDITLHWEDLTNRDNLQANSTEYEAFIGGMKAFQDSEAKLAGLHYLVPLYAQDSLKQQFFINELDSVANAFPKYVKSLPENLFVRQYLLTKGLIEQMPKTVETYKWRAPNHIIEFMAIDFKALKNSGLYNDIISGYTNLVERFPLEEVYEILNPAIDKVITELKDEPTLQQEIAQNWFMLLEQKSLFKAAEHLALKMLNQENCMLDDKSKDMFEQYRKLAVGNTAPNIDFPSFRGVPEGRGVAQNSLKDLKSLPNKYKLIVFGASWCPNCRTDYPSLIGKYKKFKENYDLEIVYIAIDNDLKMFEDYYKEAPFMTFCDNKGWDAQAVKEYHVFATPTYILLDKNLKILAKLQSPEHLESWLNIK